MAGGISSYFSSSCAATVMMVAYMAMACYNMFLLMNPLALIDVATVPADQFVHPLWDKTSSMDMRVYLSTRKSFTLDFLDTEFPFEETSRKRSNDVALLWKQELSLPSFSKSFLLTSLNCDDDDETSSSACSLDPSYQSAGIWLDQAEKTAIERGEGGVVSAMKGAGQGIESASFLLTISSAISKQFQRLLAFLSLADPVVDDETTEILLNRTVVRLPPDSPLWSALKANSTFSLHVIVLRHDRIANWPPSSSSEAKTAVQSASKSNGLLLGEVNMIKYEPPHHVSKPKRILYRDIMYLVRRYLLFSVSATEHAPWDMQFSKAQDYDDYQNAQDMKMRGAGYPYWKPEVSIKYVKDDESYPLQVVDRSGMQLGRVQKSPDNPTGIVHLPALHANEIGLTSDKYIPINETITSLPLRVSFDRSDMQHSQSASTATAGAMSPARWRLLVHLSDAIEKQKELGFEQSDIDEIKRMIADTNITLLAITMLASALHLLFEFLTFKSEVSFWQQNKDLTGLSVRSLFLDALGQTIILLFLIDTDSSLLMTIPGAIGCLIAFWKCQRAAGLKFVRLIPGTPADKSWINAIPRMAGFELRATRLESKPKAQKEGTEADEKDLTKMSIEADRIATRTLGIILAPLVIGYTVYTFVMVEHSGWYSWLIESASSAVYALGFALMTPQLFLNWKLKSVAHLPWRVLIYKSLNTFIDDLFSFIIRMPAMARLGCFRDDIVFFIYLYQRWLYPVDTSRPVEGGGDDLPSETTKAEEETKKTK